MAEYIERKMAIVEACNSLELYPSEYAKLEDALNKIPPADVAPVRHGRWIEPPRLHYGAKQYECSICYSDTFWNKHSITEKYPHCPNCGAKMRGSDDE